MTALIAAYKDSKSQNIALLVVVVIGLSMIYVAGHAQSASLHAAAHDVRHASGFPCH